MNIGHGQVFLVLTLALASEYTIKRLFFLTSCALQRKRREEFCKTGKQMSPPKNTSCQCHKCVLNSTRMLLSHSTTTTTFYHTTFPNFPLVQLPVSDVCTQEKQKARSNTSQNSIQSKLRSLLHFS